VNPLVKRDLKSLRPEKSRLSGSATALLSFIDARKKSFSKRILLSAAKVQAPSPRRAFGLR
jgi:hypothetical protein